MKGNIHWCKSIQRGWHGATNLRAAFKFFVLCCDSFLFWCNKLQLLFETSTGLSGSI